MKKLMTAILIGLLACPLSFSETRKPTECSRPRAQQTSTSNPKNLKLLLTSAAGIAPRIKLVCKTDACVRLADNASQLISDAQAENSKGELIGNTRKIFLVNLRDVFGQLIIAQVENLTPAERSTLAESCPSCKGVVTNLKSGTPTIDTIIPPGGGDGCNQDQCETCDKVFEAALAICALYATVCPTCFYICVTVATYEYLSCIETYCC